MMNPKMKALVESLKTLERVYHPSVLASFPLLSGHLQTGYTTMFKPKEAVIKYEREVISTPDGGTIFLDHHPQKSVTASSTLVVLHGLSGGSDEPYVKELIHRWCVVEGRKAVVFNARGCAGSFLTSPQAYCAAYTGDIEFVVDHILRRGTSGECECGKILMVGFSLGANILTNYLGKLPERHTGAIVAASVVASPFDLQMVDSRLPSLYTSHLVVNLRAMLERNKHVFSRADGSTHHNVDLSASLSAKSVRDFDEYFTRRCFGFTSVDDYYQRGSSSSVVSHVTTPTLYISAADDPICVVEAVPIEGILDSQGGIVVITHTGGHLGWYDINGNKFHLPIIIEFFDKVLE
jgi:uncharacterized protein